MAQSTLLSTTFAPITPNRFMAQSTPLSTTIMHITSWDQQPALMPAAPPPRRVGAEIAVGQTQHNWGNSKSLLISDIRFWILCHCWGMAKPDCHTHMNCGDWCNKENWPHSLQLISGLHDSALCSLCNFGYYDIVGEWQNQTVTFIGMRLRQ